MDFHTGCAALQTRPTINSLTNFQQTSPRRSLLALTFSVNGTQVSHAAIAILLEFRSISDATAQAQKLAAAAGMTLGRIKLFNTSLPEIATSGGLVGAFLEPVPAEFFASNIYTPPLTCSLNVQFQSLLNHPFGEGLDSRRIQCQA